MRRVWHKGAHGPQVADARPATPYAPCGDVPAAGSAAVLDATPSATTATATVSSDTATGAVA
jgi:hypothetical protein